MANRENRLASIAKWRKNNLDMVRANSRRYVRRHLDEHRERNANWRKCNKDKMDEARTKWREQNPDYSREWAARNPDKINSYSHNRRAKYTGSYKKADVEALMKTQGGRCANCTGSFEAHGRQIDHIMPIHLGGSNWPDNLQLLCPACNRRKAAKHPREWARENGLLFI